MGDPKGALVVGAGPAGATVAALLARGGVPVEVVEAGPSPGSTGLAASLLWGTDVPTGRPERLDRTVVEQRFAVLDGAASVSFDYRDPTWAVRSVDARRYAGALLDEAKASGAILRFSTTVGRPLRAPDGALTGVESSDGPIEARLTIVTDPSTDALRDVARGRPGPVEWRAEGIYPLAAGAIDRRFGVGPGQGVCVEGLVSSAPGEPRVLGSMMTLQESVSLAVSVVGAGGRTEALRSLDRLAEHPMIAPYLAGGERTDVRAHTRPAMAPPPTSSAAGLIRCGEALGLDDPSGSLAPGLNYALRSAVAAAAVGLEALRAGDVGRRALGRYDQEIGRLGVRTAMARGRRVREAMRDNPRFASVYPQLLTGAFHELMTETGARKEPISSTVRRAQRKAGVGWFAMGWDLLEAGRVL